MSKSSANVSSGRNNSVLIVAVIVVVLVIVFMYFRNQQQQRRLEFRRLERRVEVLEEWGLGGQNGQW